MLLRRDPGGAQEARPTSSGVRCPRSGEITGGARAPRSHAPGLGRLARVGPRPMGCGAV
jgi:hypothetical protein